MPLTGISSKMRHAWPFSDLVEYAREHNDMGLTIVETKNSGLFKGGRFSAEDIKELGDIKVIKGPTKSSSLVITPEDSKKVSQLLQKYADVEKSAHQQYLKETKTFDATKLVAKSLKEQTH